VDVVIAWTNRLGNRSSNQDRCLTLRRSDEAFLVVADGMGGHARGELAAQTAIESFSRSFISHRERIAEPHLFLEQAINHAHLTVVDTGRAQQPPVDPRSTCVVCLLQGNRAWWAHLGDSRLYLIRDGTVHTRTRDHTPVEELLRQGRIDEDALRTHPSRNSVSRCLGGTPVLPKISFGQAELAPGDTLLLCSDGLWSALPEQRLCDLPATAGKLEERINQIADEADVATYPHSDNISLIGIRWLAADSSSSPPVTATTPAASHDPVQEAIDEIHRAMLEYADELKK